MYVCEIHYALTLNQTSHMYVCELHYVFTLNQTSHMYVCEIHSVFTLNQTLVNAKGGAVDGNVFNHLCTHINLTAYMY